MLIFPFVSTSEQNTMPHRIPSVIHSFYMISGSNVTFVHINTLMTWPVAQSYCREHYTDLASVRNSAENQKIMDLKPAGEDVWIGLAKTSWTWSNGSMTTFQYWSETEPNDQTAACVVVFFGNSGKWADARCEQLRPFICYEGKQWCLHMQDKQT
uniref:C-type lectin domain-containing protein n=1 Tax=Oryzias sinensis TaxID=183150 RepID=A0A8C7XM47_9TELE